MEECHDDKIRLGDYYRDEDYHETYYNVKDHER